VKQSIWERLMIERLRTIEVKQAAYTSIQDQIVALKERAYDLKGPVLSSIPISGSGGNREETRRLNNIALKEELEKNITRLEADVHLHERTWAKLSPKEQTVLQSFYLNRPRNHVLKLMQLFHCEQATVYRIKDEALYKLTMLTYGSS